MGMSLGAFKAELDRAINPGLQLDLDISVSHSEDNTPFGIFTFLDTAYQVTYDIASNSWFLGWTNNYKQPGDKYWEFSDKSYPTEKRFVSNSS